MDDDKPWTIFRAGSDERALPAAVVERSLMDAETRWRLRFGGRVRTEVTEVTEAPFELTDAVAAAADGLQGWLWCEIRRPDNLKRLGPGDFRQPHRDYDSPALTAVAMLSHPDEYDGGTLEMHTDQTYPVPLGRGDIVVFPSDTLHSVSPITRGHRVSAVVLLMPCWSTRVSRRQRVGAHRRGNGYQHSHMGR